MSEPRLKTAGERRLLVGKTVDLERNDRNGIIRCEVLQTVGREIEIDAAGTRDWVPVRSIWRITIPKSE